jgi:hypothetical protein
MLSPDDKVDALAPVDFLRSFGNDMSKINIEY